MSRLDCRLAVALLAIALLAADADAATRHAARRASRASGRATARAVASRASAQAAAPRAAGLPRTLDDIHIEGEIAGPQVLFITARDQRRFMDFQAGRYTPSSLELARASVMPSGVVWITTLPTEPRKESPR